VRPCWKRPVVVERPPPCQGTMRLMFDIMDAYDRADFDRLDGPQGSRAAALAARRSLSPITVAPELTGWGGAWSQVASRSNSRKKS
jgi:hypothetical protein